MLILRSGKETDPYWNESARGVLTAFIAFVCACEDNPENRNLDTVRDLLSSRDSYAKAIEIMQMVESHGGVIRRLGHMMTWHVDRELGSVLSNVQRHTETLDSPVVMRHLVASTFNPMWLRTHRATIYLILPHDKLETLAPLMRLWIGVILRYITRGQPSEDNPVVFFLDEAAHLGKIQVLENAVTLMRGMGIRLWFFFQSLHQLNDCFGEKAKTILDNIDTQQYFAVNEFENADALSKRIGDATISVASYGENRGESHQRGESGQHSGSVSTGSNTNFSDIARRVLKPEELLTLPEDVALVFHRNMPVIPVRLLRYYSHPVFKNGGTGVQPGLGRIATEKSVCLLLAGLLFVAFTLMAIHNDSGPERQIHFLPIEGRSEPDGDDPLSGGQRSYPPAFVGRRYPR
jgi:type IV secretion system protein VirD4